ncbi:MAG: hypothetical protein K9M07_05705, partial [Simkaniaceae bacterium]|nr:hypothetical protein [Simkaniaceae bacterium]
MSESVSLPGSTRLLGAETPPDFLNDDNQSVASSVNSAARNLLGQLNLPQENAAAPLPQTAPQGPQAANPISVPFGPMPGTLLIRRVERLELGYIEIDGSVYEVLYHSGHPVSDENKTPARKEEILNNAKIMASHLQNSGNFNTLSVNTNGKVLINNDEATSQTTSLTQKDIDTYQGAAGISPETTFKTFAVATACIFNREETSLAHSPYTAADQIDARYQRSLPQQPPRRPGVMPYTAPPQPNPQPSNRPEPAPSPAESTDGDQDTASISGLSHRSENDNRSQRSAPASISP